MATFVENRPTSHPFRCAVLFASLFLGYAPYWPEPKGILRRIVSVLLTYNWLAVFFLYLVLILFRYFLLSFFELILLPLAFVHFVECVVHSPANHLQIAVKLLIIVVVNLGRLKSIEEAHWFSCLTRRVSKPPAETVKIILKRASMLTWQRLLDC